MRVYMAVRQFARTLCHLVRGPAAPPKLGVHKVGVHNKVMKSRGAIFGSTGLPWICTIAQYLIVC